MPAGPPCPRRGAAARARQPWGRERVTAAAVRLPAAAGPAGFSMRPLAAGPGVTAMSLYRYVDTKHELLELTPNRARGELPLPPEDPAGRAGRPDGLRMTARGHHGMPADHPWAAPLAAACPHPGPHARAFDAALHRLPGSAGPEDAGRAGAHVAVRQFLHGCGGPAGRSRRQARDVLIAGISATAEASRARQGPGPAAR
ncbi:TetR family transcriptional regulator [Streptomyces sp. KD18]|nr:TetR family transcriptional regulator [Streptomyces sp. KD18]